MNCYFSSWKFWALPLMKIMRVDPYNNGLTMLLLLCHQRRNQQPIQHNIWPNEQLTYYYKNSHICTLLQLPVSTLFVFSSGEPHPSAHQSAHHCSGNHTARMTVENTFCSRGWVVCSWGWVDCSRGWVETAMRDNHDRGMLAMWLITIFWEEAKLDEIFIDRQLCWWWFKSS